MGNLWIGPPGALYEIDRAAKSFERAADLGVTEFKALSGRITLTRTAPPVRRVKLSWDMLEPQTARVLDRLARRVDGGGNGVGPLVLIDPAAGNVLEPAQATGRGRPGRAGSRSGSGCRPPEPSRRPPRRLRVHRRRRHRPGRLALRAVEQELPGRRRAAGVLPRPDRVRRPRHGVRRHRLQEGRRDVSQFDVDDGAVRDGHRARGRHPPHPTAKTGAAGAYSLAGACLTYGGDGAADDVPGDGLPKLAVTGYSDTPGRPLPYRNVGVDLVEVTGATG
ncbi:hypothetical protein O1M54_23735 [Streptomyces diastatochromogenes]|nr:hypothetical protein [Streptomyces diastatochromogenes]